MPSLLLTVGNSSNTPRKEYVVDTTTEMNELKKRIWNSCIKFRRR